MITDIRIIASRVTDDEDEIEIVAEISEKQIRFGIEERTKIVSRHFLGARLFKDELNDFNDNKAEVREAWEVLRDALNKENDTSAAKTRRLLDVAADLKILK